MANHLIVGKILCPWGVRGQVKVEPLTDDIHRFRDLKSVLLSKDNLRVSKTIESVTLIKGKFVALKLENIDTRDSAEDIRGYYLEVSRDEAIVLPEGRFFISDILGLKVLDEDGKLLGVISDIFETKAHDVYTVKKTDGSEFLIPAVKEVIRDVDLMGQTMTIKLWEGLM